MLISYIMLNVLLSFHPELDNIDVENAFAAINVPNKVKQGIFFKWNLLLKKGTILGFTIKIYEKIK